MARYRIGTCGFTEKSLDGTFYPEGLKPSDRISYYSSKFDTVEIDSRFYYLPSERNSFIWAEKTPPDFIIHFKAFSAMTNHPLSVDRLPTNLRGLLPEHFEKGRLGRDGQALVQACFEIFGLAVEPLARAGKLGFILFQFPPYFIKSDENMDFILTCKKLMARKIAVEFRHKSWVKDEEAKRDTLEFLSTEELAYVSVDEPQFEKGSTMPSDLDVTTDTSYIRFHGRDTETWFKKGISASERFHYLYALQELDEWTKKMEKLSSSVKEIYLMFNNCHHGFAIRNASEMKTLLLT